MSPLPQYRKYVAVLVLAAVAGSAALNGCSRTPQYEGQSRAHFDGVRFSNTLSAEKSVVDIFDFMSTFWLRKETWPDWVENGDYPPPPKAEDAIVATFINHSTVLLQLGGVNVLTDPIWAERASPFSFAGPRRVREAGLAIDELPPIDVIVISHDHYDHLDIEALQRLQHRGRAQQPLVLAGLGNGGLLKSIGLNRFQELDWGDEIVVDGVTISFVEVRHRSGRGLTSQMKTLWGGFVINSPQGRVYFAGDTGYGPHFHEAREHFGRFDLSLVPIGAYRPRSFMAPVHLDPEHAVRAHRDLGSKQSLAVHHGTFQLTYEAIDEPYRELAKALASAGLPEREFRVLGFGESMVVRR